MDDGLEDVEGLDVVEGGVDVEQDGVVEPELLVPVQKGVLVVSFGMFKLMYCISKAGGEDGHSAFGSLHHMT